MRRADERVVTPVKGRGAALALLVVMVALMWVSESVDWLLGHTLDDDGVVPRTGDGLWGILVSPLLHGGWPHLIGNSIALLVLGTIVALSGLGTFVGVTATAWLLSGVVEWLLGGSGTVHIGASGIVFGYLFFVLLRGVFTRSPWHLLVGLAVAAYYGWGAIAGLSPLQDHVSWQGHLGGAIAGGLSAAGLRGGGGRAYRTQTAGASPAGSPAPGRPW